MAASVVKKSKSSKTQKRRHLRIRLTTKATLKPYPPYNSRGKAVPNKTFDATILNISQGGVLVVTSNQMPPGQLLTLNFQAPNLGWFNNVVGKVKRVEPERKKYLVGIEFCDLSEFYTGISLLKSGQLPNNLESFSNKLQNLLLRKNIFQISNK
ncbi:MAG: PilZ domain-containing protein [candidate division Zixibacteria bacterium]|nr:PilZ domain-containing protein [candidate division Zixibacteria bacterium]